MATYQPSTSRENGEIANNPSVANAEIEAEISHLRNTIEERAREAPIQGRQEEILDKVMEAITGLQDQMSRMELRPTIAKTSDLRTPTIEH